MWEEDTTIKGVSLFRFRRTLEKVSSFVYNKWLPRALNNLRRLFTRHIIYYNLKEIPSCRMLIIFDVPSSVAGNSVVDFAKKLLDWVCCGAVLSLQHSSCPFCSRFIATCYHGARCWEAWIEGGLLLTKDKITPLLKPLRKLQCRPSRSQVLTSWPANMHASVLVRIGNPLFWLWEQIHGILRPESSLLATRTRTRRNICSFQRLRINIKCCQQPARGIF